MATWHAGLVVIGGGLVVPGLEPAPPSATTRMAARSLSPGTGRGPLQTVVSSALERHDDNRNAKISCARTRRAWHHAGQPGSYSFMRNRDGDSIVCEQRPSAGGHTIHQIRRPGDQLILVGIELVAARIVDIEGEGIVDLCCRT